MRIECVAALVEASMRLGVALRVAVGLGVRRQLPRGRVVPIVVGRRSPQGQGSVPMRAPSLARRALSKLREQAPACALRGEGRPEAENEGSAEGRGLAGAESRSAHDVCPETQRSAAALDLRGARPARCLRRCDPLSS